MGKGTDKLYITHSEWNSSDAYSASAGSNVRSDRSGHAAFKRLPFNFCALSLQPFDAPVCTPDGLIFDHENIIRWLMNHNTNPVNGRSLRQSDLIKLEFAKNDAGDFVDPVTYKVLTDNTHIVGIRHGEAANVFAWDTVERLNIKPKMWRDLVSDETFTRSDIITLQDPQNVASRNLSEFKYLKEGEDAGIPKEEASINTASLGSASDLKIMKAKEAVARARAGRTNGAVQKAAPNPSATKANTSNTTKRSNPVPYNATHHTTGQAAASLTSTGLTPHTSGALALMSDEDYLLKPRRVKSKGYARINTTHGELTLELYPEHAPKAVYNFIRLAQRKYYDGIIFHRNIKNFMIQTGDPTGTGRGGSSVWNKNFNDEFEGPLKHDARGIVSMANKGRNTNSSQFFILYRQAAHLNHKHTIFGRVVEGLETLNVLEKVETDQGNKPLQECRMVEVKVLIDPFEEFMKQKQEEADEAKRMEERRNEGEVDDESVTWTGKRVTGDGKVESGAAAVGSYLKEAIQRMGDDGGGNEVVGGDFEEPVRKKMKGKGGFGDFSGW